MSIEWYASEYRKPVDVWNAARECGFRVKPVRWLNNEGFYIYGPENMTDPGGAAVFHASPGCDAGGPQGWCFIQHNGSGYTDRVLAPMCRALRITLEAYTGDRCCDADGFFYYGDYSLPRIHQV